MKFPKHEAGMYISHNEHKDNYEKIEDFVSRIDLLDWASESEREKSIKENEIWQVQWYPKTPVGFCVVYASTLEAALEEANKD